ncbi:MAG: glycosyltransferase family 4 protein [Gammaproteobacteria bacterium]|nr:glycosyltransferase family 4 protein [Gammaproteobacteria bacterium]
MTFKVAYVLDCFPVISQTFISDEIYYLLKHKNIEIEIFSLNRSDEDVHHERVSEILDDMTVNYLRSPGARTKIRILLKRFLSNPIKTINQLYSFTKAGQERWINLDALYYAEMIQQHGIDHIHSHFADQAAKSSMAISMWTGIPFTFTTHGYDVFFQPPENYVQLADKAKYVFAISHYNKAYLIDKFQLQENKVKVIYCGIDYETYHGITYKPQNIGARVSLLTVARLHPVKGHKYLLEALSILRERIDFEFDLYLAGDGSEMDFLKGLTEELKLTGLVYFLGNQSQSQVYDLLKECDCFVLPSISEGLGIVLLEAMASSRLVVAPAVNGVPELIIDNETGFLFKPEDSGSLADAIERAFSCSDRYAEIIETARSKVVREFSKDKSIDLLVHYWDDAANEKQF